MAKFTARQIDGMRLDEAGVRALAKQVITREVFLTTNAREIKDAFYMVLTFCSFTEAATKRIGAIYGMYSETVPGRAMNGYPIFLSCGFVHVDNMVALRAELERMQAALDGREDD